MTNKKQYFIIKIGDKDEKFEFKNEDPIFKLSQPNDDASANQNPFCNCCKENYKSTKEVKYCQFCTLAFCQKCRYKTRVYPKSKDLSRGECCKICDRKFFIKDILSKGKKQCDSLDLELTGNGGLHSQIDKARQNIHNK